eukprot:GHVP01041625.1.p2 GENE.GHVP01041625.1~~GHVP01041625.1.p2  ORF type:complete len:440 (-),score=86.45 GHVP01041625.1:404-1723(-)
MDIESCLFRGTKKNTEKTKKFHHVVQSINELSKEFLEPTSFKEIEGLESWALENLERNFSIEFPSKIQLNAIPKILKGDDVLATAPTGSGKTIAFLLPILSKLKIPAKKRPFRALVLTPTRELAIQIGEEFEKLADHSGITCWVPKSGGTLKIRDIAICTPLRLVFLLREKKLPVAHTEFVVFDEVDKLLDLGFAPQIDEFLDLRKLHSGGRETQYLAFSATCGERVLRLAQSFMLRNLQTVSIGSERAAPKGIEQELIFVTREEGKVQAFRQLLALGKITPPCLVFVQSISRAQELFKELVFDGLMVDVMHGDKTQAERAALVEAFKDGKIWVLVTTDMMSRGIDFIGVNVVVNFDFPQSTEAYVHRIGRTGRAGRKGVAFTFYTELDIPRVRVATNVMRRSGCEVPTWIKRYSRALTYTERKELKERAPRRKPITRS